MQEYRFRESGYNLLVGYDGHGWIIKRHTAFGKMQVHIAPRFETREEAMSYARVHYKIIRDLVIEGRL